MVLVAPQHDALMSTVLSPALSPALIERSEGAAVTPPPAERPPARDEVLALLRGGSGPRPQFDAGLAGGYRAWLEDAASAVAAARGDDAPPLFLGPRTLFGPFDEAFPSAAAGTPYAPELVASCLVRALFRQIVMIGRVGDPLADGLHALGVDPRRAAMVRQVGLWPDLEKQTLSATLATHVAHLLELTPRFASAWLPRTDDRVAIPLAGGRVVLSGVFDLLVGVPTPGAASLCAIGLTTGGRWAQARTGLHYLALLETLRSGTPPFRLALLQSALGRHDVEDVREEHLRAMVSHLVARVGSLATLAAETPLESLGTGD
jgi:hypothetical protein